MADSRLPASTATSRFIELPSSLTEYELCTKPIVTAAINKTDDKHQGTKSAKIFLSDAIQNQLYNNLRSLSMMLMTVTFGVTITFWGPPPVCKASVKLNDSVSSNSWSSVIVTLTVCSRTLFPKDVSGLVVMVT